LWQELVFAGTQHDISKQSVLKSALHVTGNNHMEEGGGKTELAEAQKAGEHDSPSRLSGKQAHPEPPPPRSASGAREYARDATVVPGRKPCSVVDSRFSIPASYPFAQIHLRLITSLAPYIQSFVTYPRCLLPGSAGEDDIVEIFCERQNGTVNEKTGHYPMGALPSANVALMSGPKPFNDT
jgi:hypothetical protein